MLMIRTLKTFLLVRYVKEDKNAFGYAMMQMAAERASSKNIK